MSAYQEVTKQFYHLHIHRARNVSFGRCRKLAVDWFDLLKELRHVSCIEVGLPPYISDEELAHSIPYLQHATRLNVVGKHHAYCV